MGFLLPSIGDNDGMSHSFLATPPRELLRLGGTLLTDTPVGKKGEAGSLKLPPCEELVDADRERARTALKSGRLPVMDMERYRHIILVHCITYCSQGRRKAHDGRRHIVPNQVVHR